MEDIIFNTTEKHFETFQKECLYWIKKLSLLKYEFFFRWEEIVDRANSVVSDDSKIAVITLSKIWYNVDPTSKRIRRCAFHEVLETFLNKIFLIAINRNFNPDDLEAESHTLIRTMENTFFVDDYNRRFVRKKK